MSRVVILPKELDSRLDTLTSLKEEVKGVMFYRPLEKYCPLEYLFMTAVGNEGHVKVIPERLEVVNEFFRMNPTYHYVEFHTHSVGTINTYGQYYARNFSEGDKSSLQGKLNDDPNYLHLLVTPKTKLLWGSDNPELLIVDDFHNYDQRRSALELALKRVAHKLGYNFENLKATSLFY